jgi:predicted metalloprotease with PDZ domain
MKAHYLVDVQNPEQNIVKVTLKLERPKGQDKLTVFMPSWSPGSYMIRDYARHIRWVQIQQANGEPLFYTQIAKNQWEINWKKSEIKTPLSGVEVTYAIYLNELTVRTSHVNASHAFLHGPSYLMGVLDLEMKDPTIEFRFTPAWSKVSTSLKDVSEERAKFIYSAPTYDELIDCPVEIGCHETDGFMALGKPHNLAFYGITYPHATNLKKDIKTVVETVAKHFDNDVPYDQYLFLTHFAPNIRGGLEHLNSTALQFDGRKLGNRKDYVSYLSLVAHEYFHLWNVKRIRPVELGPFDYQNENYTSMLWLSEGLTSLMDDLFVYRAGLCTIEEYLEQIRQNLDSYYWTPGKKFHSLEQSSFNAWIKLYRPDENYRNSSVSYYLKGGLVFGVLHSMLFEQGKSIDDLLIMLWQHYKSRPEKGITKDELYGMIKTLGGEKIMNAFSMMVETTEDIDFETAYKRLGCEFTWSEPTSPHLGCTWEYNGERVFVKTVYLDSPAYQAGINPGDEIMFVNNLRLLKEDMSDLFNMLEINRPYEIILSRMGRIEKLEIIPGSSPKNLKEIRVKDKDLAAKAFGFSRSQKGLA